MQISLIEGGLLCLLLCEVLFVAFYLDLDEFEYVLDVGEVALLADEFFLDVLDSLAVLLVEVLEGVDEFHVLEGDQALLEHAEVEHLHLIQSQGSHAVRQRLQHQHDVEVLIQRTFRDDCELGQESVDEVQLALWNLEITHVHIVATLLATSLPTCGVSLRVLG